MIKGSENLKIVVQEKNRSLKLSDPIDIKFPMNIPTASYGAIAQEYCAAIDWMEAIGIKVSAGRTTHYAKVIDYWKDAYKSATEREAKDSLPEFVSSVFEIHDFIDIYKAFKDEPLDALRGLKDKLEKGVNGPINSADETSKSTSARNYIFEALMAARSHHPHRGVNAILNADSDTGISIDGKKLWIECKRISSASKIEANVKDASNQLEKILSKKKGSGNRGVVAIDVTKIINPSGDLYVQQNDNALIESIDRMMDQFITNNSSHWEKVYGRRSKKIIGTTIRFSVMATSEERNLFVRAGQWAINPRISASMADTFLLETLVASIKNNQ